MPDTQSKTKQSFELVHVELWGPAPILAASRARYHLNLLDDYSSYTWVNPITLKSQTLETFKQFRSLVKIQFERFIKALQTNRGVNLLLSLIT